MGKNKYTLYKLERRFGKYAVRNLMTVVIGAMAVLYALDFLLGIQSDGQIGVFEILAFNRSAVLDGQVWRIITFAFLPPGGRLIFVAIILYFYYIIGSSLENEWGSFRFNIFYLVGVLGTVAAGFIFGYAANGFLNLSMFFAFALLYPEFEILLFFILPVKVKYLAYLNLAYFIYAFIIGSWAIRLCILVSFINIFLFFNDRIKAWAERVGLNLKFRYIRWRNSRRERRK